MIPLLANHLWQSTLFAVLAGLLTLALNKNRPQARYWLWLTASVKFLVPFSLLVSIGSQFQWRDAPPLAPSFTVAVEQISQPFAAPSLPAATLPATTFPIVPALLLALWFGGCTVVLSLWWTRWRRIRAAVREATPLHLDAPVPVMSSPTQMEPGVFGVFRPVLLLPEGIADRLTHSQLQAILAHEFCHVRRRDNLAAFVHMAVEAIFWFHPLVWWIGARLVEERERACDEEVLRMGSEPLTYAEGILTVCKFYFESPLACASGVTGSELKKRIEGIMADRISYRLTVVKKLLLAIAGTVAVAGPIVIGVWNVPAGRAQPGGEKLVFDVASIKPADPDNTNSSFQLVPGGGLRIVNYTLKRLVAQAYDVRDFQISGGPSWFDSERWDINAKPDREEDAGDPRQMTERQQRDRIDRVRRRLQALLTERFQLTFHRDTKQLPIYSLVLARNGHKLQESKGDTRHLRTGRGQMTGEGIALDMLTPVLSSLLGRPVVDHTGLQGRFDLKMEWAPDIAPGVPGERPATAPPDLVGASIFTAIQEQLGLKLESQRGPVEIIVIDRGERASEN